MKYKKNIDIIKSNIFSFGIIFLKGICKLNELDIKTLNKDEYDLNDIINTYLNDSV